ncbi:hypothetical protein [Leptospira noguchii]|uniref:Uncharacterized protein n=3 Tax=Leptospira noguchii TaxID=28182 RepID=M6XYC8_9LEPT|nr:hypothetical protein [Leptospira noguchii]EKR71773.1 hypothetical protein LEP1GSC041_2235 [Leptospira noguchii str. 2006001870]EMN00623.1 hypothetical protein LEP1GSC035_0082 [Leptospira noguchii str. 2007001578]EMO40207.1 hypothetical protein LEP1GSC186_3922 [Leptospira noguchii serovar Autumnalis str. ZUN142]EMO87072.1 hypothetical protein LEP1GSC024_0053 [Leptospira noguchii str. 2001034031]EPE84756.1 hypothetical protein LEP1GSC021_3400 [Leptospira noguchii str. 1993005606]
MKLKKKYSITFLLCNLLTGAESAVRRRRIRPNFYYAEFTLLKSKNLGS